MSPRARRPKPLAALLAVLLLLASLTASVALAGGRSITKSHLATAVIAPGRTITLTVPYPDALEYGNARYSGHATIRAPRPGAAGRPPTLAKVTILDAHSVEGGSAYEVRARNANRAGTAPVRLVVTATTVEPLPHH